MKTFNNPSTSIKNWAFDDRPREKLLTKGPETLSNAELLGILINNGHKDRSALELAKDVLRLGRNSLPGLGKVSVKEMQQVKGIGLAKAITIAAALELGRRRQLADPLHKTVIRSSGDIAEYLRSMMRDYSYEVFAILYLNRANRVNHFEVVSKGGINGTIADTRLIIKRALQEEATSIVLCHNHPSGNLRPSKADEALTLKIKQAAAYFDILVTDHIIVSDDGYYSFADEGMI